MHFHDFSPRNPFRPPHWRWERAGLAVQAQLPLSRKRDDRWSARATKYRAKEDAAGIDEYQSFLLSEKEPGIFWARKIWDPGGAPDVSNRFMMRRYELEARILAEQPRDDIAHKCGLDVETVEAYEHLFFDVRDRLEHTGYISQMVMGPTLHRGVTSREYDLLWKLAGYMRGPVYLEMMITTYVGGRRHVTEAELRGVGARDSVDDLMRQSLIAGKTFRLTRESQCEVLMLYQKVRDAERAAGDASGEDTLMLNLEAVLRSSRVDVGKPVAGQGMLGMSEYDGGAVEPSGLQLVDASFGRTIEVDAEVATLSFPRRKEAAGEGE